jgi:hypothetical protein
MNDPYHEIMNISFLVKLFFKTFISFADPREQTSLLCYTIKSSLEYIYIAYGPKTGAVAIIRQSDSLTVR